MADETPTWALGLMSGTSLDGIDAALVRTDGLRRVETGAFASFPYAAAFRERLRGVLGGRGPLEAVARDLTLLHAEAVRALLAEAEMPAAAVRVIGFHGHTVLHEPERRRTWQIGDGALLAAETGIDVVSDMRQADVGAGGEGAPLAPLYHAALASGLEKPLAVLNIGGVANVTWIGAGANEVLAFDCGPGNALLNDWMERHGGQPLDRDGALAAQGTADPAALRALLADPYFDRPAPKSLDRDHFDPSPVAALSVADGAATLTAFTAAAAAAAVGLMPAPPARWLVTGGGRHNPVMMAALRRCVAAPVDPVEAVGWQGDVLEAQAFGYLAVRSLAGLPLSLPTTTGVARPITGGRLHRA